MSNNKSHREELIKEVIQRIYDEIEVPDSTASWKVIEKRLKRRKRVKRSMRMLQLSSVIIICAFMMNLLWMAVLPTAHSQISELFKKMNDNFTEIFHKDTKQPSIDKARTTVPPDDSNDGSADNNSIKDVSFEYAKDRTSFRLKEPTYIPKGYEVEVVRAFESSGVISNVQMKYSNSDQEVITIMQQKVEADSHTPIKSTIAVDSGTFKDVTINNSRAILLIANKGNSVIEWVEEGEIIIRISGALTETEIIKIASSLQ